MIEEEPYCFQTNTLCKLKLDAMVDLQFLLVNFVCVLSSDPGSEGS